MSPAESSLPAGCSVLLLEDDAALRRRLRAFLETQQVEVSLASSLVEARRLLQHEAPDFALVDLHLPDGDVLSLLREGAFSENTGVVVMTAFGGIPEAVEAMRLGASDFLAKPFEPEQLALALLRCRNQRRVARREEHRNAAPARDGGELFFGRSLDPIRRELETLIQAEQRLQRSLPPVLIEGETGTGKSVLARWLHARGPRAEKPFVSLNCAALPDTLAEAELFGHERGAFTDAKQARVGLFEAADGGTLFLDEVGSLSSQAQAKLLTAVEEFRIRRLGGTRELSVDVRVIAASNQPLAELVSAGRFREDLLHRLRLFQVTLPPLRERRDDLLPLARHLLERIARRHRLPTPKLSPLGEARLLAQTWRGNLRELSHELERALIFSGGRELDFPSLAELPPGSRLPLASDQDSAPSAAASGPSWRNPLWHLPESGFSLDGLLNELIAEAMRETKGNVSAAARRLGVTRDYLRYRLPEERADHTGTP